MGKGNGGGPLVFYPAEILKSSFKILSAVRVFSRKEPRTHTTFNMKYEDAKRKDVVCAILSRRVGNEEQFLIGSRSGTNVFNGLFEFPGREMTMVRLCCCFVMLGFEEKLAEK